MIRPLPAAALLLVLTGSAWGSTLAVEMVARMSDPYQRGRRLLAMLMAP